MIKCKYNYANTNWNNVLIIALLRELRCHARAVRMYASEHMHTYMNICTYIYIYTHTEGEREREGG